ncbi:MAG: flagellar assembly protein FliH [Aliiglaciecola sp.]|uniref:flagellar assembly protein FliH n=1 Tax=Aliiglaciecola sp. M165 TaxID=2593649 RepID=UPI001180F908|nr:flagellar assembly protein FliH [Aliiglaciecola sp. M165]TRY30966.1 flagellar assembly protein FliH [Aliiglaciecola sp. M165]
MSKLDLTEEEIASWDLPYLEDTRQVDDSKTNALNRQSNWKYEPPEPEEEILPPTAEEIEAIREAAYKEGFEQGKKAGFDKGYDEGKTQGLEEGTQTGMEQGLEEGIAAGQEQVNTLIASWQSMIEHVHQPVAQVDEVLQNELVKLAVSLARAVIRHEVQSNPDILRAALQDALKTLPIQESSYQIHMHPEDILVVKQTFSEEQIQQQNWLFVESPGMSRGGCDVTTSNNAVDVSIERRARDVLDKFLLQQGLSDVDQE